MTEKQSLKDALKKSKKYKYEKIEELPTCDHGDKPFVDYDHFELYSTQILKVMQEDLETEIDNIWGTGQAFIFALMASSGDDKQHKVLKEKSKPLKIKLEEVKIEISKRKIEELKNQ